MTQPEAEVEKVEPVAPVEVKEQAVPAPSRRTFQYGDIVLLRDRQDQSRVKLVGPLRPDGQVGNMRGQMGHDAIEGKEPRDRVDMKNGEPGFILHEPTLEEYTLLAGRHCTPVYPKDASAIASLLDIHPGDRVLDAGTGNGALALQLALRARSLTPSEAPTPSVYTVERREDHHTAAKKFVAQYRRGMLAPHISFHLGDVKDVLPGLPMPFDAAVLDMPDSHLQLMHLAKAVKKDGHILCYVPHMTQVMECIGTGQDLGMGVDRVVEVAWREWDVRRTRIKTQGEGSPPVWMCRPAHRPVGHTGFLLLMHNRREGSHVTESAPKVQSSDQAKPTDQAEE